MFDRLKRFLEGLPGPDDPAERLDRRNPQVAAVALLIHLIDADGTRDDAEFAALRAAVGDAYALSGSDLDALLEAGEQADRDAVDLYDFTSVLTKSLPMTEREAFVGMMWEMVFADKVVHELEDHILWRIAELIGVDRERRVAIRRDVQERLGVDRNGAPFAGNE